MYVLFIDISFQGSQILSNPRPPGAAVSSKHSGVTGTAVSATGVSMTQLKLLNKICTANSAMSLTPLLRRQRCH
jgi:hypothetical protein